jgi:cardiolipin synthase A/B
MDNVRVIVEPDDGTEPVVDLIRSASKTVQIKQFTLSHPVLLQALFEAHGRGVAVRVMLNAQRSSGSRANDESFAALEQAGVAVQWSNPVFAVTHEKSLVVDERVALVATFNYAEKYFTTTRDYGLVIHSGPVIAEMVACFNADWEHSVFKPPEASPLLWSPVYSRKIMAEFIDRTKHRLEIQHPKLVDATILDRILAAKDRGAQVRVLCGGRHGISEWDLLDTFSSLRILQREGVRVHKQKQLRVHAKLIIVDDKVALVGSMNIDRSAFDLRRELGITVGDPAAVRKLCAVFARDWDESRHYDAPDPLISKTTTEVEGEYPKEATITHE